jgi:hypothetical protein
MLVYHPAFDSYHCLFRSISILEACQEAEVERLRILDFCLSFPAIVKEFRLPRGRSVVKRTALTASNPYRDPISARTVFANLAAIQTAAFSCLAATGLVSLSSGTFTRTPNALPDSIRQRCLNIQATEDVFFGTLLFQLKELPLLGPDGLKARSGLMEYRYDPI